MKLHCCVDWFCLRRTIAALFFWISVSSLGALNIARADDVTTLTVETIVARALANSPLVKQIDATLADNIADSLSTRLLPNPSIDTDVRLPGSYKGARPDTEIEVALEQPFRLSHFGLRDAVANLMSKAGHAEQKIALLQLTQNVRLLYARAWALEAQSAVIEEGRRKADTLASLVKESSEKGILSLSDASLFEAVSKKLSADAVGLQAELSRARAALVRATGFERGHQKFERPNLLGAFNADELLAQAESGDIPVQLRARLRSELAQEQRKLAERDSFPMLSPRLLYQHTAEGEDQYGVGIRIELPFSDRNQAERTRASAQASAAASEQNYFLGEGFKSELKLVAESLKASSTQIKIYETEVIPALREALKGADRQLQAGQGSVIQLFQTQRELNEAAGKVVELWVQAFSDRAELSVLTGTDL